uniref:Zinc finger CCHC-type containing 7 n=1 Tax=Pongo abelii TaxID=9601 RepID=A0A8I5YK72_PONAB
MMFGGYETIEAYEDDLYRDESSSELSVDSEVEFQLYSQIHYAQDLDDVIREEEHEEKNSGNSESSSSKPNQKKLIVLSDSEVIQLSDGSEVITLSDEDSIYRCKGKNVRVQAQENAHGLSSLQSKELVDKKCKSDIEKPKSEERPGVIREVMIIEVSSSEEEESTISEGDNVESWMLLGCEVDDKDNDILLNLVGCENSVTEGCQTPYLKDPVGTCGNNTYKNVAAKLVWVQWCLQLMDHNQSRISLFHLHSHFFT